MPGRPRFGCTKHCNIWWYRDGLMMIGCAHCPSISTRIHNPVGSVEQLERAAEGSRTGHQVLCGRPIR